MNTTTFRESESITRAIAKWGSVVAALMFGIAFVADRALSYRLVAEQAAQVGLILFVFAGYLIAWKKRFELVGSILALGAVGAFFAWCQISYGGTPELFLLAVALPAVFHLVALALPKVAQPSPDSSQ
ncbi:MAG: hypothetical protein KDA57_08125 [Planctomycetales bacterium]|nr:hypothetical protein [Planctomycetales bacterium]